MSYVCNCQKCKGSYPQYKSCQCEKCKTFETCDTNLTELDCSINQCVPWGACGCNSCWFPDLTRCCHIVKKAFCIFVCRANEIIKSTIWKLNELWICGKICRRQYVLRYGVYLSTIEKIIQLILLNLKETPINFSYRVCQTPFHKIVDIGIDFLTRLSRYILSPDLDCNINIDRICELLRHLRRSLRKIEKKQYNCCSDSE